MTRWKKAALGVAVAVLLAACGGGDRPRGELLGAPETVALWTKTELDSATAASGLQVLSGTARCDVRLLAINYVTRGPKGEDTNASGALLLPAGEACGTPAPLLAYARGTDVHKPRTLASLQDGETFLLAAMYAAQGYAVVATDYLGFAKSDFPYHPYLHAESEASTVIDSIRAARLATVKAGAQLSGRVMLTGYSQGGHASAAAHREIEKNLSHEIQLVGGAHLAGPFNLSGASKLSEATAGYQFFVPFIVTAWQKVYGDVYRSVHDVFRMPFATYIENLLPNPTLTFATLVSSGRLPGALGETPNQARDALFQPAFVTDLRDSGTNGLYLAARKNDVLDWKPVAPTLLCSGKEDPVVPQALHQDVLKASWDAHGLDRVISVDVDPLIRATYGQVLAADPLGYYSSYHGAYAPPFCHASARDLFNQVR